MKLLDTIKRRIVWILTGVVVYAALSWLGFARAQTVPDYSACFTNAEYALCEDEGMAISEAAAAIERKLTNPATKKICYGAPFAQTGTQMAIEHKIVGISSACTAVPSERAQRSWKTINSCAARDTVYAGYHDEAAGDYCYRGCKYSKGEPIEGPWRVDRPLGNSITFERGQWEPSGATCTAGETPPPPKDDYCAILDGGHKICRDKNGRPCVISGKTGRKYCPSGPEQPINATPPDRTENVTQSPEAPAPGLPTTPPTPRPGENFAPGTTVTTTNTTNNTTVNTTISNNTGTPNTNPNQGNPGDGSGNPGVPNGGEGEGEGEDGDGEEGEVSGGGDCSSPPACSGNPLGCWAIEHNWRIACESNNEGIGWLGEMDQAVLDSTIDEAADWGSRLGSDGQGDLDNFRVVKQLDAAELDASGFLGGASCPQISVGNVAGVDLGLNLSTFCDMLVNLSGLVMSLSYFLAFRIIAGGGRT